MSHHTKIALKRKKKENLNKARTRLQKVRAHAEYVEANKDVKRSARNDKRKYMADLTKEAETAASQHNMKTLYDPTQQMSSWFKASNHQIKDINGRLLTTTEDQNKRCVEHFQQLLNRRKGRKRSFWDQESIPSKWKEGLLVKLPKKGDLSWCKNYRRIMLLSTAGNVLNRIILERIREAVDEML